MILKSNFNLPTQAADQAKQRTALATAFPDNMKLPPWATTADDVRDKYAETHAGLALLTVLPEGIHSADPAVVKYMLSKTPAERAAFGWDIHEAILSDPSWSSELASIPLMTDAEYQAIVGVV